MVLGPYILDLLDPSILAISSELRKIALVIILLKAGFSLDWQDLVKVGRPAILLSFLPACLEILCYILLAPLLLGLNLAEAALMGAVLAAVSPAMVVPRMVHYIDNGYGTDKGIPQMLLAGASCDDIFVLVLFTSFLGMAGGDRPNPIEFFNIPLAMVTGVCLGLLAGYGLYLFFESAYKAKRYIRNSMKIIIILAVAFLLMSVEVWLEGRLAVSGLLAVVSMALMLRHKSTEFVAKRLSEKLGKLWLAAEVLLFVLVGAAVDLRYTIDAGLSAICLILSALIFRSLGVWLSTLGPPLSTKERFFCILAYLPKATVQAAIGSVPLSAGLACGNIILSVAVMGIIITAPLGALGMDLTYKNILTQSPPVTDLAQDASAAFMSARESSVPGGYTSSLFVSQICLLILP